MNCTTVHTSTCPICSRERAYKTRLGYLKGINKPCKSCSNSIKRGGVGVSFDSEGKRLCKGCNKYLKISSFYVKVGSKLGTTLCKTCSNNSSRVYNKTTYKFKKYGISQNDFESTLAKQNNSCAICKSTFQAQSKIKTDHDHKTGKFRGLLCHNCNVALGHFQDNLTFLKTAIKYLKKWM